MTLSMQADLSAMDGECMDGLIFCGRVYDLYEQIRSEPDGVERIRLRKSIVEKRLIEELIPLARYIQARYREIFRIEVTWSSGSQPYDPVIYCLFRNSCSTSDDVCRNRERRSQESTSSKTTCT